MLRSLWSRRRREPDEVAPAVERPAAKVVDYPILSTAHAELEEEPPDDAEPGLRRA